MFEILYMMEKEEFDLGVDKIEIGKDGGCWHIVVGFITPCGTVRVGGCTEI